MAGSGCTIYIPTNRAGLQFQEGSTSFQHMQLSVV